MGFEDLPEDSSLIGVTDIAADSPTVTFESITFSDGTKVLLDAADIVVFVGPNNSGKSLALQELENHLDNPLETIVVKSTQKRTTGTIESFGAFISKHLRITTRGPSRIYSGARFSISTPENIEHQWPSCVSSFRPLFCTRIPTETRITDSNPVDAIAVLDEPASHPIHMLYSDDQLEHRISGYFQRAFGEELVVFHAGGRTIPLFVGERPTLAQGEQRTSRAYSERLRSSMVPLNKQGDGMRSFASVVLHLLSPVTFSILLLDEPEAFLHPPQARLLGEVIATEKPNRAQLYVATHSPDVLHGLINVAPEHLRVLRMQRDGNVNRIKELDKEHIRKISADPLMKYSSVLAGVFHERVIVCEADADCMFYSSLLDLPVVHGERQPDILFVHANGKDRMATLATTLVALDVPVDIVADMDVLNDLNVLKSVITALDGDWGVVEPLAMELKSAIEGHKPWLTLDEIKKGIKNALDKEPSNGESARQLRSRINAIFRKASPWDTVKQVGEAALPQGHTTQQFQNLQRLCKKMGLWIVPAGEMEGFCRSVGNHGPSWVQHVIEQRDLANDHELESARMFVREIWEYNRGKRS